MVVSLGYCRNCLVATLGILRKGARREEWISSVVENIFNINKIMQSWPQKMKGVGERPGGVAENEESPQPRRVIAPFRPSSLCFFIFRVASLFVPSGLV